MQAWVYLIPLVLIAAMLLFSQRSRRKQLAAELERTNRIGVGTEVMTTSGLYATVVTRHEDGTVVLGIAPGVEVKWALAALRDSDSIPAQYRQGIGARDPRGEDVSDAASESVNRSDVHGKSRKSAT